MLIFSVMVFSFVLVSLAVYMSLHWKVHKIKAPCCLWPSHLSLILSVYFYVVYCCWSVCICHTRGLSTCTAAKIFFGQAILKSADIAIAIHKYIRSWSIVLHHWKCTSFTVNGIHYTEFVLLFFEVTIHQLVALWFCPSPSDLFCWQRSCISRDVFLIVSTCTSCCVAMAAHT